MVIWSVRLARRSQPGSFQPDARSMSKHGHDAIDADGHEVQIKLTEGNSVSMFADCERLIVLRIVSPEEAEIVYDGPGAPIWAAAGSMQKNGQRKIGLTKLRAMAEEQRR